MIADMESVGNALTDPGRGVLLDRMHGDDGQMLGQYCNRFPLSCRAATKNLAKDAVAVGTASGARRS